MYFSVTLKRLFLPINDYSLLWDHLKNLGITNRCHIPRKKRGGRRKPRIFKGKCDTPPLDQVSSSVPSILNPPTSTPKLHAYHDNTNTASVNLCVLNARSVSNKSHVLCDYLVDNDLDIFALTKGWLSDASTKDKKTIGNLTLPGYDLFHIPRLDRRGGGVTVIHKQTITRSTNSQFTYLSFQSFCCDLTFPGTSSSFKLIVIYNV